MESQFVNRSLAGGLGLVEMVVTAEKYGETLINYSSSQGLKDSSKRNAGDSTVWKG